MTSDPMLDDLRKALAIEDSTSNWSLADVASAATRFLRTHGPALLARLEAMEKAEDEMPAGFGDWFRKHYPGPDTIINRPDWHAPKIWRAAMAHRARGQS